MSRNNSNTADKVEKVDGRQVGRVFGFGVWSASTESTHKATWSLYSIILLLALAMVLPAHANNISIGTPTLTGLNTTDHYTFVQFDLSWDNSWRDATLANWDAAWVFVKYKVTGGDDWAHATLNTSEHSVTTNNGVAATITTPSDGKGVFLYLTNTSTGSINWDGVKLRWNTGPTVSPMMPPSP